MTERFEPDEVEEIVEANEELKKLSPAKQRGAVENARREQEKELRKGKGRG